MKEAARARRRRGWTAAALVAAVAAASGLILSAWLLPGHVAGWMLLSAFCA